MATVTSEGAKQYHSEINLSIAESVYGVVTNKDPVDKPLLSALRKGKATALYEEWLADTTTTFQADSHVDAETFTFSALSNRTRQGNYCQKFIKTFKVGNDIQAVRKYGVASEYAYQMGKAMDATGTDMEYALVYGTSASGASSTGTATAPTMAGIDAYIQTYSATGSASGTWTSTALNELMQSIVSATTGKPSVVYESPILKRASSAWTTPATQNINVEDKRLVASISVYEGDFGIIKLVWSRWLSNGNSPADGYGRALILDESTWEIKVLRPTEVVKVPALGDYQAGALITSHTLIALAETCNAKFLASSC